PWRSCFACKFVGSVYQSVENSGLGIGVTGSLYQEKLCIGPCLGKLPRIFCRAWHVIATMHDHARNAPQLGCIAQQLPLFEPAAMNEKVVLDAREGEREVIVAKLVDRIWLRQQGDRLPFPTAPCDGRLDLLGPIIAGQ